MAWFTHGKTVSPTVEEARALWDDEAPVPRRDAGVMRLVDAFRVPGQPPVFTGWVESGTLRNGQSVLIRGNAGFARGTIGSIAKGQEMPAEVSARAYVSIKVHNINRRLEILGLDRDCTITGI